MELARSIGPLKFDPGVVLELDTNVVLALVRVNVVKAMKEPVEVTELEGKLGEVMVIEGIVLELLELEGGIGRALEELLRLKDGLYSIDDAVDEVLRLERELTGDGCSCGCSCGCICGCNCLGGPLMMAVGTTRDV